MVQTKQTLPVSVIVPVYNAERYIFDALSSILKEQDADLDVIVVNDGSTDGSLNEVRKLTDARIRLVDNLGKGIADALNTGLAAARGQFVVRCDADDLYPAYRIAQQVRWLSQNPEFDAVCGGYAAIDPRGSELVCFDDSPFPEEITAELCAGFARTHLCTYAIRTEVLRSLGGFRPYFATGEDIDLQLRLGEVCRVWYQPGVYYYYRLHRASITHTKSSSEREFFDAVAREFQVQRQTAGLDALQRGNPPLPPKSSTSRPMSAAQHIQKFLLWRAWYEHQAGQKWQALSTGMRSVMTMPSNLATWKSVLALAFKPVESSDFVVKPTFRP
ncbi:MAG: glycosyltransferase family 2 protein [Cyanobacteria bacterium RM1_2_2]|nr:glycosyltransferase family 2 protein [Cyanobacteria bacterium RM1_2_2]